MTIRERLQEITQAIGERREPPITIVAVTKYATLSQMKEAYEAGIRNFGENKVQDALAKMEYLPLEIVETVSWHLIGHLQRNKVRKVIGRFALIHSVDSLEVAQELSLRSQEQGLVQKILLQVNISGEASKHGFSVEELHHVMPEILQLHGIHVVGLMTMAPANQDEAIIRQVFCGLRELRDTLAQSKSISLPELSMGMSQDYVHAIGCGATIIRVGTYLFSAN